METGLYSVEEEEEWRKNAICLSVQEGGLTPLLIAVSISGPDAVKMVQYLLDALADPDARAAEDDSYLNHFLVRYFSKCITEFFKRLGNESYVTTSCVVGSG